MTAGWTETTLGEVTDIISGATPSTSEKAYWDGDVCWATPKDLSELEGAEISDTARKVTPAGLRSCAASVLPVNSVLLSSRAPIGLVAINTVPMATNQGFKSLVPDRRRVDAKFLYWWLRKNRTLLESLGNGATFKEISKKTTSAVPISLPPMEEQRRIASILDAADALRSKRRQALEKLDTLTQSIFIDMFGGRPGQSLKHPIVELRDVVRVLGGKRLPKGSDYADGPTSHPYIRVTDLVGGTVAVAGLRYLTPEVQAAVKRYTVAAGDVIVSIAGSIGEVAAVPLELDGANLTENAARLVRKDPNRLTTEYLAAFLRSTDGQRQMVAKTGQVTIGKLALFRIESLRIPLPAIEYQHRFAACIAQVKRMRPDIGASYARLDALFSSLQHRAFRGEL